jgi:hypothetical protein
LSHETYNLQIFCCFIYARGVHHWSLYHEATNVPLILRAPCMYPYTMSAAVRILGFKQSLHNFDSTILTRGILNTHSEQLDAVSIMFIGSLSGLTVHIITFSAIPLKKNMVSRESLKHSGLFYIISCHWVSNHR